MTSLPPRPNAWMVEVLATVGVPPRTATAPLLTRILPAASRLIVIVLSAASPKTERVPPPGVKNAVTAGNTRSPSVSSCGVNDRGRSTGRRGPRRNQRRRRLVGRMEVSSAGTGVGSRIETAAPDSRRRFAVRVVRDGQHPRDERQQLRR